ncbi:MAG: haloacid dehalogenase type II [Parvularculaceae bacterium]
MARAIKAVVFDIIETCFSLEPQRAAMAEAGFSPGAFDIWFARSLRDGFALAASGSFARFRDVLAFNLDELAAQEALVLSSERRDALLAGFAKLPPHSDTVPAYTLLHEAGFRLFALSNGATAGTSALLSNAGIDGLVEKIFSVEDWDAFKPQPEIYQRAVAAAELHPGEAVMAAAHAWDVHGAKEAGLKGAFVARGQRYPAFMTAPDFTGETLADVVQQIVRARA